MPVSIAVIPSETKRFIILTAEEVELYISQVIRQGRRIRWTKMSA